MALDGPRPGRQSCGGVHSPSLSPRAGALPLVSRGAGACSAQGLAQAGFPAWPSPPPCKCHWFPGRPPCLLQDVGNPKLACLGALIR